MGCTPSLHGYRRAKAWYMLTEIPSVGRHQEAAILVQRNVDGILNATVPRRRGAWIISHRRRSRGSMLSRL